MIVGFTGFHCQKKEEKSLIWDYCLKILLPELSNLRKVRSDMSEEMTSIYRPTESAARGCLVNWHSSSTKGSSWRKVAKLENKMRLGVQRAAPLVRVKGQSPLKPKHFENLCNFSNTLLCDVSIQKLFLCFLMWAITIHTNTEFCLHVKFHCCFFKIKEIIPIWWTLKMQNFCGSS